MNFLLQLAVEADDEIGNARQHGDVIVLPDAGIARGDTAAVLHRRGLHHHQAGPADGTAAQVNQMPVIGKSIHGGALAHR